MTKDKGSRSYYAKILLFGEYTVIFNSNALTIPFGHFSGEISFINKNRYTDYDFALQSNMDLVNYGGYLSDLQKKGELLFEFNEKQFEKDIKEGMFFESNIPMGYGLGSSGALVAGLYENYALDKILPDTGVSEEMVMRLKKTFEQMESFFHGKSSGLDPLNCYFRCPMLLEGKERIRFIDIPKSPIEKKGAIFLVNTERSSRTQPLVELFMMKAQDKNFSDVLQQQLIPLTNQSIDSLLEGNSEHFFLNLKILSGLQKEHFKPMIPDEYLDVWEHGLTTGEYFMKLCGSGGGGFLLGFTRDFENLQKTLKKFGINPLRVYTDKN
jgi:mevalonate kinase